MVDTKIKNFSDCLYITQSNQNVTMTTWIARYGHHYSYLHDIFSMPEPKNHKGCVRGNKAY